MLKSFNGSKYGLLTIVSDSHKKGNLRYVSCLCECGNIKIVNLTDLKRGRILSCGCKKRSIKHGLSNSRIYKTWKGITQRCYNVNNDSYNYYGGRGISMDIKWKDSFEEFYNDMFPTWKEGLSIDRIDNELGYSKDNCRWCDHYQQNQNRRGNIISGGLKKYCRDNNLNYHNTRNQIKKSYNNK